MNKCSFALASLVAAVAFLSTPTITMAQGEVGGYTRIPPPLPKEDVQTKPGEGESSDDKSKTERDKDSAQGAVSKSPYGPLRKSLSKPFELVPGPPLKNLDAPPPTVPDIPPAPPGRQLDNVLFWICMLLAALLGATVTMAVVVILGRRSRRSRSASDTIFVDQRLFDQIKLYADMRLLLRLAEMFRGGERFVGDQVDRLRSLMAEAKKAMLKPSPNLDQVEDLLGQARGTMMGILRSDPKTEKLDRTLLD